MYRMCQPQALWTAWVLSCLSPVPLFVTLWTGAHQAPLSMWFSRQEYWSRVSCPPPGDLSNPGIEPMSLMSPALAGGFCITSTTWEALIVDCWTQISLQVVFLYVSVVYMPWSSGNVLLLKASRSIYVYDSFRIGNL